MDSLTQATLGAAVGETVLGRKLGNWAMLWGALFGTLPDLDVISAPFLDTAGNLVHHRGASHSILVMVVASLLLAPVLARLWRRKNVTKWQAGWFVFWVWSTHVLIDVFTVYGTSVFWPFSDYRAGFNNLFIIDLFFTLPLLVSLAWVAFLRKPERSALRRRVGYAGLGVSSAYVCMSLVAKWIASAGFAADLERRGITYERRMEAPTAFNIVLWRCVVDRGDELWVGFRRIVDSPSTPVRWTIYPRGREAIQRFAHESEVRTIDWFSDGWWIARPLEDGVWMGDLRFGEVEDWRLRPGMVDKSLVFSWVFDPDATGDRLLQVGIDRRAAGDAFGRLGRRILGESETFEGIPHLLWLRKLPPELLRVMD